jgi:hypothetical protein
VTGRPATATVRVAGAGAATLPELAAVTARAREEGRPAVVVATGGDTGRLVAVNREIGPATGLPTVCVAGALGPRLVEETVRVEISARLVPGRAANVVGTIGDGPASGSGPGSGAAPGPATLVTTPLSGWFRCAGERGTGIAVALEVARRLAERGPVVVAGTSGHELQGAGQAHLMERLAALAMRPSGVLHVGASAAAGEGEPLRLAATRWAGGWVGADRRGELAAHVERLGARAILPATPEEAGRRESWLGEAQAWSQLGVPLLSIAGAFPLFHTPGDVPAAATTPALLAHVADTLSEMATLLP